MKIRINGTKGPKDAQKLSLNFDKYLKTISNATEDLDYANCAWFDIDTLELYLSYIKVKAYSKKQKLTGIRIYFGNYDNEGKKGKLTVFISPTIGDSENKNLSPNDKDMDIEVLNFGQSGYPPKKTYPHN
ncbi:MAG: hypothetical protein ACM3PT_01010 [Deltaproteobacteria bacterium]